MMQMSRSLQTVKAAHDVNSGRRSCLSLSFRSFISEWLAYTRQTCEVRY